MVNFVQRLRMAFPRHHLLVDIDDGYVDPEVACHVVGHLERIGASGVVLEDQKRPRRCGHVDGKQILPLEEYLEKLNLVLEARQDLMVVVVPTPPRSRRSCAGPRRWRRPGRRAAGRRGAQRRPIRKVRAVVGDKPLLFNQIAGGKSRDCRSPNYRTSA